MGGDGIRVTNHVCRIYELQLKLNSINQPFLGASHLRAGHVVCLMVFTSRPFLKNGGRYCFGFRRRIRPPRRLRGCFALYLGCY